MNIKELAHQAGFNDFPNDENGVWITDGYWDEELKRFAELILEQERKEAAEHYLKLIRDCVATEREANVKLLEDFAKTNMVPSKDTWRMGLIAGANAIRTRGDKHDTNK